MKKKFQKKSHETSKIYWNFLVNEKEKETQTIGSAKYLLFFENALKKLLHNFSNFIFFI